MRKTIFVLIALTLIMLSSCGGGDDPQTLSGLEGRWAFNILIEDNPDTWKGNWDISSSQILSETVPLTWSYDGSILAVRDNQFETIPDATCGDRNITRLSKINLKVAPTDQYASISGSMDLTEISPSCDPVSKTLYLFGNALRISEENLDLTALAGTWDVVLNMTGTLDGPLGIQIPIPISDQINTTWTLTPSGIQDADGLLSFNYNGSSLVVQFAGSSELTDSVCGQGTVFFPGMLSAAITSGSTSAIIDGLFDMTYVSDNCGKQTGTITVTGTMTKRP
jgi:hypothetical protein